MQGFEFACPTKIVCGAGSLHKLADEAAHLGMHKPMVVTDGNLMSLGVTDHALAPLREAGVSFELFSDVPPDSSLDVVNELVRRYTEHGCDGFIALGGGSVIDTTKGAGAALANGGVDFTTLQGSEILRTDLPPFIAIPTTAGTGSETTLVAVVADTQAHTKLSYTSYRLVPQVALLDPVLTQSLPPKLTATTGMDALTHAIEAYTSIQKNPVSDALAIGAIRLIVANLDEACKNPGNVDARTNLALGSTMAGAAFSNAMVGIVHAIGHSLGGLCHVPHGQAMMMLLPHCVRFNIAHGYHEGLYGELLEYVAPQRYFSLPPAARDKAFEAALFEMNTHYNGHYGVPLTLAELGIDRSTLEKVAQRARYDGAALYNQQEITQDAALEILEGVFA